MKNHQKITYLQEHQIFQDKLVVLPFLNLISGILAELQKKDTFGSFERVNLKPTGDKKFLFFI